MCIVYIHIAVFLVDGGWSDWQSMTNCSTTYGEGVITQQRTCTQPSPSCGGRECSGINITNISCSNIRCRPGIVSDYVMSKYARFLRMYVYMQGAS